MILDEIAAKTRERVARCKENVSLEEMKKKGTFSAGGDEVFF